MAINFLHVNINKLVKISNVSLFLILSEQGTLLNSAKYDPRT